MPILKKLVFIPLALVLFATSIFFYQQILRQYLDVFFKPYGGIIEFGILAAIILVTSLSWIIFMSFSQSFKYLIVPLLISALIPFLLLQSNVGLIIGGVYALGLLTTFFNLQTNLKTYINFKPTELLIPAIKLLNTFTLIPFSLGYYFYVNTIIQTQGFKLPETLIDWAIDLSLQGQTQNPQVLGKKYLAQIPTLTQEQIDLLKQNPQILEAYGLDAADLDEFIPGAPSNEPISPNQNAVSITPTLPGANLKDVLKAQITDSIESMLKPYHYAIPVVLAFMFYSLSSLILWLLSFFLSPIISLLFLIFDKSGFVTYQKEMREVKKMII